MGIKRKPKLSGRLCTKFRPKESCWDKEIELRKRLKIFSTQLKRRTYSSGTDWLHLEGNLITCILCGRDAIVLSSSWSLPDKLFKSFCHCTISTETADLSYHWCIEKDAHRIVLNSIDPLLIDAWWKSTTLDITTFLKPYLNIGYMF